ncbi:MAG: pyridoxamine 5'-phosphate oxidase family protein [Anaerolineae bacterium]
MNAAVLEQVRAFLKAHHTLTLATRGSQGEPQAADLYYVLLDGLQMGFISSTSSRHIANIQRDPRVACTVHAVAHQWRDIRGVQIEGTCALLSGWDGMRAWARYVAHFPFVLRDAPLLKALRGMQLYCITPHWVRWIDNSIELGYKVELVL